LRKWIRELHDWRAEVILFFGVFAGPGFATFAFFLFSGIPGMYSIFSLAAFSSEPHSGDAQWRQLITGGLSPTETCTIGVDLSDDGTSGVTGMVDDALLLLHPGILSADGIPSFQPALPVSAWRLRRHRNNQDQKWFPTKAPHASWPLPGESSGRCLAGCFGESALAATLFAS
jgi:hypothetical protein